MSYVSHQTLHEEGEQYLNKDGEVYTIIYGTERRVCDLVWEAFKGEIPEGYTIVHIAVSYTHLTLPTILLV